MAPMTRGRAEHETHLPTEIMETYYEQRATAGLIITEGVVISRMGNGYINIPGIYNEEQVAAWKKITGKVHAKGGKIFAQIWHVGRISHPDLLDGELPLAPSAINPNGAAYTLEGMKDTVTPRAMTIDEIQQTISDFRIAAENAVKAGFDGVELHAANGYLFHQFLATSSNTRTDEYGGSIENRARFLFEVLDEVVKSIGQYKTGIRLNPDCNKLNGIILDEETTATFDYVVERLNKYDLAYLHLTALSLEKEEDPTSKILDLSRKYAEIYDGNLIINEGFDQKTGARAIADGLTDLVAYGAPFVANPDLVKRYREELSLNNADTDTYFQGGTRGYIDYPLV